MSTIDEIRERCHIATPGPWQHGRFVDKYPRMSQAEKEECIRSEQTTIRGPGRVGEPECNVVCRFLGVQKNDMDYIIHARQDIPYLLSEVDRLTAELEQHQQAGNTLLFGAIKPNSKTGWPNDGRDTQDGVCPICQSEVINIIPRSQKLTGCRKCGAVIDWRADNESET